MVKSPTPTLNVIVPRPYKRVNMFSYRSPSNAMALTFLLSFLHLIPQPCTAQIPPAQIDSDRHSSSDSTDKRAEIYRFIIAPQPLANALIELADIAGMTIVLPSEDIVSYNSKAVVGNYTVLKALEIMLTGSGLQAELSQSGTLKIAVTSNTVTSEHVPRLQPDVKNLEELLVTGVLNAYQIATQIKRENVEISEIITEEDIGKMPDNNIADALQRVPGVQLERHNGVGSLIRVRGFAQNLNLLNNNEFLTGMELYQSNDENYEGSYESFPIDLLQRVEVYKTPSASQIEGSVGGTIDFITRSGFNLTDPLFIAELGLNQGSYSKDQEPTTLLILGNNWNDKLALMASLSYRESTNKVDNTNMYTDAGAFVDYIYENERSMLKDPDINLDSPLLYPSFSSVNSTQQHRGNFGSDIRLEYRLTDHQQIDLQWFNLDTEITEQRQTVLHNTVISDATVENLEPIRHDDLMTIKRGDFTAFNLSILSRGEKNKIQADNLNLSHNIDFSDQFSITNKLQYLHSRSNNRAGEITSEKGHLSAARFVGSPSEDPDIPGGENHSGWDTITVNPGDGDKERSFMIDREKNGAPLFTYTNSAWLTELEYGAFSNQVANGYDNEQTRTSFSTDFKFKPEHAIFTELKAGLRFTDDENQYDKLAYLTDYSRTEGVGSPNLYDSDGNIVTPATYDPTIEPAPEQNNIGIRLPVFYDLCGNGGIISGEICDIDGDGKDDNQPLGPYGYETGNVYWGLTLAEAKTSANYRLLDRLYGRYIEDTEKLPNYAPSLTWGEASERIRQYNNFYSSGNYQHQILLPDLDLVTDDTERWIDQLTPATPGKMRVLPLESWEIEQQTQAFYVEASFSTADNFFTGNTGARLVHTQTEIFSNSVPESLFDVRISPEISYSGIPLVYETNSFKKSYTHVLPSINTVVNFSQQLKLRTNLSQNIARPRLQDLGKGYVPTDWIFTAATYGTADDGNPELKPYKVSQFDISLENYWDSASYFAFNLFIKDIQSFIQYESSVENRNIPATSEDEEDRVATVSISRPENIDGGLLKGFEFSIQKLWQSGFGVHFNYTYMDSKTENASLTHNSLPLPGISKETYNLIGMYEGENINFRLAYNRRTDYLSPFNATSTYNNLNANEQYILAEFVKGNDRLDARMTYHLSDAISVSADIYNLTSTPYSTYLEYDSNTKLYQEAEPFYELSLKYKLN